MELIANRKIFTRQKLLQILKFGVVGSSGLVIDFVITWLCKEQLQMDLYLANIAGFMVAVTNNYLINRRWSFANTNKNIGIQFTKFLLVSIVGLLLNTACIFIFHQLMHIGFYNSKCIAITIVFFWNYFANAAITFKN